MSYYVQHLKVFSWNNRGKLIIAAVIAIGSAALLHYNYNSTSVSESLLETHSHLVNEVTTVNVNDKKLPDHLSISPSSLRSKMLIRARKQFESASRQFLMTLRLKIIEEVDVISAVRQIKEIRAKSGNIAADSKKEMESKLWEDIKIGSFTLLYVTIYMSSTLAVLLKVQMHLLAKHAHSSPPHLGQCNANANATDQDWEKESNLFRILVEGTYTNLFGTGLVKLVSFIREILTTEMCDWTVRDKLSVGFNDTVQLMTSIREKIEHEINGLIRMIIIPEEDMVVDECSQSQTFDSNPSAKYNSETDSKANVTNLMGQLWDIAESPNFAAAIVEATDACYRLTFEQLRRNVFTFDNIGESGSNLGQLRTPPLASLLPQVKAIASSFLPNDVRSVDIKELFSGPILESLCVAVFDATNAMP